MFYGPPGTGKTLVAGLIGKELGLDVCEVKSSNDRYANLEVNYLLQRLDSFEGVADGSIPGVQAAAVDAPLVRVSR